MDCNRFTQVIRSLPISVRIKTDADLLDFYFGCNGYFDSQVVYLRDDRQESTFAIDLSRFINIRTIHLLESCQEQINQITPTNHPFLTRLSLPYRFMSWNYTEPIFFGREGERFSLLQSVANVWCNLIMITNNGPINETIRHIHLPWANCEAIIYYAEQLPKLVSIDVSEFSSSSIRMLSFQIGENVRRLKISRIFEGLSLGELTSLFHDTIPNLHYLQIDSFDCDFEILAKLLQSLKFLRRVCFKIHHYSTDLDLVSIRKLSPFFTTLDYGNIDRATGKPYLIIRQ